MTAQGVEVMPPRKLTDEEKEERKDLGKYLPTPEEIKRFCEEEIQPTWSEATRLSRKSPERPVDMTTVYRVVEDFE